MSKKTLYKVIFFNHGKVYELYARSAGPSGLYGFVEVADLVFAEGEGLVVDPTEEKMREEFKEARCLHLPIHSVIRIEEVDRRGVCLIRDRESGEKITPFPVQPPSRSKS